MTLLIFQEQQIPAAFMESYTSKCKIKFENGMVRLKGKMWGLKNRLKRIQATYFSANVTILDFFFVVILENKVGYTIMGPIPYSLMVFAQIMFRCMCVFPLIVGYIEIGTYFHIKFKKIFKTSVRSVCHFIKQYDVTIFH